MDHGERKGMIESLVDFSFTSFVTGRLIQVLYIVGFSLGALVAVLAILRGFSESFLAGLGSLVLIPLVFLIFVMFLRVWLEVLVVVFRIAEDVRALVDRRAPEQRPSP